MPKISLARIAALGLFAATLASAAVAPAETVNKCNSAKRKCVAKLAASLLACHAKAVKDGDSVDADCLAKGHAKFDGGTKPAKGCFEKLETKFGTKCLTQDDTAEATARVDAYIADVVAALEPTYPAIVTSPCTAGKLQCVARHTTALLGCQAKAALTGTLDPKCVLKTQQKFDGTFFNPPAAAKGCFEKLEAKGKACLTTDDTAALAEQVEEVVATAQCSLDPLDPACVPCPTRMAFTPDASDPTSRVDLGWIGFGHRQRLVSDGKIALAISDCANAWQPCGACALVGPIDPPDRDFRRCTGNTFVRCTSDAQCIGNGTCAYFPGPPLPMSGGNLASCLVTHVSGPVTGTLNPETGEGDTSATMTTRVYVGIASDQPCPRCAPSMGTGPLACQGGQRANQSCEIDGTSPTPHFGDVSLDCPPQTGLLIGPSTTTITSTTGFAIKTLTAASPSCRGAGATSKKCLCDTCNGGSLTNATLIPCSSDADCPDPAGPIGPICGGPRCSGGANAGAACEDGDDCASGNCSVPGHPTKPNSCNDGLCVPDGQGHGLCMNGPAESYCAPTGLYVPCTSDFDCSAFPGDTCSGFKIRQCFLDNGDVGGAITGIGVASPTDPTWTSVSCMAPTQNTATNIVFGYPGPVRMTQHGSMTIASVPGHRVFATSTLHDGALGGLAGADAICQARADAAALGGTYKAWLSDAANSAASRLTHAFGDYVLVDGTVVAHGWSDLTDGTLLAAINRDEAGASVTGSAWTNATVYGAIDAAECDLWSTTTAGDFGQTGSTAATNAAWTDDVAFEDCAQARRLYCFEQ